MGGSLLSGLNLNRARPDLIPCVYEVLRTED
jgi:hypothetical protein